ncbi:hypothetical protein B1H19_35990 [Streptomyces gilvosporeus]|uniref:Uncharacterized protein n=1 Tax=Streptomyces gilvosporeus TaxID=553510 RepID=A0A1V0U1F7_9ACTN|nr:hypothetical protein B1H19_35990 [Streptomyces gilvosporeus]
MSVLSLIDDGALLAGATGVLFTASVATVAAASILARSPERRRDARETLKILLEASRLPLIFTCRADDSCRPPRQVAVLRDSAEAPGAVTSTPPTSSTPDATS